MRQGESLGSRAEKALRHLRFGEVIEAKTCILVAHPDDETLGMGARLGGFHHATLIHLTDGSPEDLADARNAGFADANSYAQARAEELDAALAVLGASVICLNLGLRDRSAAFHLPSMARQLADLLRGSDLVVTHPYEGGHPDHDSAAFAVAAACQLIEADGRAAPLRLEFASYHAAGSEMVTGRFWPDPEHPAVDAALDEAAIRRKRRAMQCFASQAAVLASFAPEREAYRVAPTYRFVAPPPPGAALYDRWGWDITSERWRFEAAAALRQLGLAA